MTDFIRIAGAQVNLTVGDVEGNVERILAAMAWAEELQADVLLLPELAVTGYPPEDLVLRRRFLAAQTQAGYRLAAKSGQTTAVVGTDLVRSLQAVGTLRSPRSADLAPEGGGADGHEADDGVGVGCGGVDGGALHSFAAPAVAHEHHVADLVSTGRSQRHLLLGTHVPREPAQSKKRRERSPVPAEPSAQVYPFRARAEGVFIMHRRHC